VAELICGHEQLTADVKASLVERRYYLAVRAFCLQCTIPFEVIGEARSDDGRQIMVELRPTVELVSDISKCQH
jgi:hypothetical protein